MVKKKKGAKRSKKKTSKEHLRKMILKYFKSHPKKKLNARQLIKKLKLKDSAKTVQNHLLALESKGFLFNIAEDKYRLDRDYQVTKSPAKIVEGIVDMTRQGSAFIIIDSDKDDVFVPSKHLNFAMDKDVVKVELRHGRRGNRQEGKIVKIVQRANSKFVGLLRTYKGHGIVHIDHGKNSIDIFIENEDLGESQDGDRVIVDMLKKGRDKKNIWGRVTTTLGDLSDNDLEMNSILINSGFNIAFPEEVITESEAISETISDAEIEKRRDLREVLTFTIDPEDAKDFDDAISYEELENDAVRIGVHIADVSHYVKAGTAIDKEAYLRSTSVYLVDRVCPMLPEKLSNGLCSLRPNEDKLCFSAIFDFDKDNKITEQWIGRTVIHSDKRFTYEEAQESLESKNGLYHKELSHVNNIAKALKKQRFKKGAINFETDEVRFRLDEASVPISVYVKQRKDAHMLVEDFMLLANKAVASFMAKLDKKNEVPFVYRVHDEPDLEKLADLALIMSEMGIKINVDTPKNVSKSLNKLAKEAQTKEHLKMLQPMAIRTMAKAVYTSDNIGHFGLAFQYYTHFTSPIRRYSDVLVHRILAKNLKKVNRTDKEGLEAKCKHISAQERKAMDAERESTKYKQVEYMKDKVGESFDAFISGMIERGIFVELTESRAEGLIGFDQLSESFAMESNYSVRGKKSGSQLKLGDPIRVKLIDADMEKKRLEFIPV